MRDIALVWTNCGSAEEAETIGRALIEARAAACVNIEPIQSLYRWEGEIRAESEVRLLAKTMPVKVESARRLIAEAHSYELPAIVAETAAASNDYAKWLAEELTESDPA